MEEYQRSHLCGELSTSEVGDEVTLMGWVHRRRDHGGLIFVDLRDASGLLQVVFSPEEDFFQQAQDLRDEYVILVQGVLEKRPEGTENLEISSGQVELPVKKLIIISEAQTPPFSISDEQELGDDLRLKYRYLDLRRKEMRENIVIRYQITRAVRDFLDSQGFLEIETPNLTRSTPEGARDYLIPSRVQQGKFFALPQSPQLFKQLLMVSGFERYFQIARCYRDEDLRADRQPEFTQIDIELSFASQQQIMSLNEQMMAYLFQSLGVEERPVFQRVSHAEARLKYGTDKPDLRYGLEIHDLSDLFKTSEFRIFRQTVEGGGVVRCLRVEGGASFSRGEIDRLTEFVQELGAGGLAWIVIGEDEIKSPIASFLSEEEIKGLKSEMEAEPGDLLLFVADKKRLAETVLGRLRIRLAEKLDLIPEDRLQLTWVTDFPLFEVDEEGNLNSAHHPFTAPIEEDLHLLEEHPEQVRARAYDLVLNGMEIGGGSIRITDRRIQQRVFSLLGLKEQEIEDKFGFLLEAFQYGVPPHGGIAYGLDRLVMLLAGRETIRDVIPFPKTQRATCLLTGAPTGVSEKQLSELALRLEQEEG